MPLTVTQLNRFLVKSCAGESVQDLYVGQRGPIGDRIYALARAGGKRKFISQRDFPRMCMVRPFLVHDGKSIVLTAPDMPDLEVPFKPEGKKRTTMFMHERVLQVTVSETPAAEWFAVFLKLKFEPMFVFQSPDDLRHVKGEETELSLQDGYPFMIVGEESLQDLNARLEPNEQVPMENFRPNIVCAGAHAYEEDRFVQICINKVALDGKTLCSRCVTIGVNQKTGKHSRKVMDTLKLYRMKRADAKTPVFGRNFAHINMGSLHVGAPIKLLG